MKKNAKTLVLEFIDKVEQRYLGTPNAVVHSFLKDSKHLIHYNECRIALENLLDNLYDYDIKISLEEIALAKAASIQMKMNWEEWKCIHSLAL